MWIMVRLFDVGVQVGLRLCLFVVSWYCKSERAVVWLSVRGGGGQCVSVGVCVCVCVRVCVCVCVCVLVCVSVCV